MNTIDFLVGIHNHQPVGNFGYVFEDVYEKCYKPQLEVLSQHPGVRIALHHSGPLLEWIEDNRPEYFDIVGEMVDRGQVEILSGGFYEPILSSIPVEDAVGQIVMMNDYIKKRFGSAPEGMWMAERIWDPYMPIIISAAGLKYTILDDTHFYYTGLSANDMFGYYMTEKHGASIAVFPIDKKLRYKIPFSQPFETIDYLKYIRDVSGARCVTYADDGEKFGSWPETHKWVYGGKWLHNFYTSLEDNSGTIHMTHFSEYIKNHPPLGRIYLPMASYEEMMEWALPAESGTKFTAVLRELGDMGKLEEWKPFIRGGLWDNFLAKYDESNRMHKKMLYVSRKVDGALKRKAPEKVYNNARRELFRGQCNCAYWHGMFGGLYLNYLRHAMYQSLINAEKLIDDDLYKSDKWNYTQLTDFDMDGAVEAIIENPALNAYFDISYGGSLFEFDFRPASFSLSNTLSRRREAYHDKIFTERGDSEATANQPASIHDTVKLKEEGLAGRIRYDRYHRRSFQDRFVDSSVTLDDYKNATFEELGNFVDCPYVLDSFSKDSNGVTLQLSRNGEVRAGDQSRPMLIAKTFSIDNKNAVISASYLVTNKGEEQVSLTMVTEFNLTLLAADASDRYWIIDHSEAKLTLREEGTRAGVSQIGMRDDWSRFEVTIKSSDPIDIYRFPVETVSQSESGFERTYQGSCIALLRPLNLSPGESLKFAITLSAKKTS